MNKTALRLYKEGHAKQALNLWQKAAELEVIPGLELSANAELLNNLGFAYYRLGGTYFEKAEQYLKGAVTVDSSRWTAYLNLGDLYSEAGRYDDAIKNYKILLNRKPDYKYRNKIVEKIGTLLARGKQKPSDTLADNAVADPIAAQVAEITNHADPRTFEGRRIARFVADFNNDWLKDMAIADAPCGNGGCEWRLYLQDKKGGYHYKEDIFFHPLAISIQPLKRGTSRIITYHRGNAEGGILVESMLSDHGMTQSDFRTIQPGIESHEQDRRDYDTLFGKLLHDPVSEYCLVTDYLRDNCGWNKGY